jgi:copper chaperone CopZ
MTCAHIVNVALTKLPGVESVNVSVNQARATVRLKTDNTISVRQLWRLLRDKGYTPQGNNSVCTR